MSLPANISDIGPAYPLARRVAELVEPRFARVSGSVPVPSLADIAAIIDSVFWASLRREEGYVPKISAAFLTPDETRDSLRFATTVPCVPEALGRLAPAVERPGIHLGIWRRNRNLEVWGTTTVVPEHCFVVEVNSPGLLVIKQSRTEESGKFANVAVLEGDRIKLLSEDAVDLPDCPPLMRSLLGFEVVGSGSADINSLVQLAASMRSHGRGGSLLVVPRNSDSWRESIISPITYAVSPPYTALFDLLERERVQRDRKWREAHRRTIDAIAGLTAVDGATVITDAYELLAFGAKISRRRDAARLEQVFVTEPVVGCSAETVPPLQLGGTRHVSAAQFAQDQQDAIALVASQDGRFTIFAWSPCEGMVHAHRVEALLL